MGGYGSGRPGWRPKVESGISLSIDYMATKGLLSPGTGGSMSWSRNGSHTASIGYSLDQGGLILTLNYTRGSGDEAEEMDYQVGLLKTPAHFGGLRTWFLCPLMGCKSGKLSKLYLPSGAKYFACRKCYNLTYTSCSDSHRFDAMYSLMARELGEQARDI